MRVTPREGILDPEGQTIESALRNLGYDGVSGVRAGRLVHLRLEADDEEGASAAARRMCEELIANPVIEDYEVRVSDAGARAAAGASEGGDGT
ncbi:MAG: phosphoribosylformylglycinamidine synthase subunit PurS [Gemmatimonadota bacterium]